MTCEICGRSQMNVATYTIREITKIDACTKCIRIIDEKMVEMANKYRIETTDYIKSMLKEIKND